MSNSKKITGLTKQRVIVKPYTTTRIDYNDTKPNYYRVQNGGNTPIYCGTSHMPTANNYDFMCNASSMKMYGEPFNRTSLYIFNPSGNEINVTILSFSAEFDPLTLALSEISIDLPTVELGASIAISSFETSLPKGENHIGSVTVENLDDLVSILSDTNSIKANTATIKNVLDAINPNIADIEKLLQNQRETYSKASTCTGATKTLSAGTSEVFTKINFFSNDSEQDITLNIAQAQGVSSIIVKPGEVLNDIKCYATNIEWIGDGATAIPSRIMVEACEV